jgi:hypothetical protein
MGKRSFVRINVESKQYKLDRRDIIATHHIKKSRSPAIPTYTSVLRCFNSDAEFDSDMGSIPEAHFLKHGHSTEGEDCSNSEQHSNSFHI